MIDTDAQVSIYLLLRQNPPHFCYQNPLIGAKCEVFFIPASHLEAFQERKSSERRVEEEGDDRISHTVLQKM